MKQSEKNLSVLENFILFITHSSEQDNDTTKMNFTPKGLYELAVKYIDEDHVDGKGNPNEKAFNVTYYTKDGDPIDNTQIDEKDEVLAWQLFKEFGHTKEDGMYLEFEETTED